MTNDPTDRHLADLRRLASVPRPLDLAAYEEALTAEALAELEAEIARRRAANLPQGIDWERIRRMAERHRR